MLIWLALLDAMRRSSRDPASESIEIRERA